MKRGKETSFIIPHPMEQAEFFPFRPALAVNCSYQPAGAAVIAEFAQVNALPGTQVEPAVGNGNTYGRADQSGFDMGGHIIRAFNGVPEER